MSLPGIRRPKMCPTWTPPDPGCCRPKMCPTWTPGILGATGRECVQLGHRGSRELPSENVSNLDTGDPGSCRPEMCPTWTPGILGATGRECVQLGHRGSREPPAENVSNLDTRDPGSRRPEESCRPRLNNLSTMVTIKGQHRGVILLPDGVVL